MKTFLNKSALAVLIMLLFATGAISFTSGGFGESTGAPLKQGTFTFLGNFSGCQVTGCHSGNPLNDPAGSLTLTTEIPSTGWTESETYNFTLKLRYPGRDVYGFKITSWGDVDSASVGEFTLSDTLLQITSASIFDFTQTEVGKLQYVTHTGNPLSVTANNGDEKTWSFQWTAPEVKDQNISFFIAGNAANGNGQITGDYIYYKTVSIGGNGGPMTSIDVLEPFGQVSLYPNPVVDMLTIRNNHHGDIAVKIFNINGTLITSSRLDGNSSIESNLSSYAPGLYFVSLTMNDGTEKKYKIIKN